MGLPPSEAGAVQVTCAEALPAVAETPVGAPGTAGAGVGSGVGTGVGVGVGVGGRRVESNELERVEGELPAGAARITCLVCEAHLSACRKLVDAEAQPLPATLPLVADAEHPAVSGQDPVDGRSAAGVSRRDEREDPIAPRLAQSGGPDADEGLLLRRPGPVVMTGVAAATVAPSRAPRTETALEFIDGGRRRRCDSDLGSLGEHACRGDGGDKQQADDQRGDDRASHQAARSRQMTHAWRS